MLALESPPDAAAWWPSGGGLKERVLAADARLAARFWAGEAVQALVPLRAWVMDQAVREAWRDAGLADGPVALVATGGFGRGELFPHSDVDVLALIPDAEAGVHEPRIEAFFKRLWDEGFKPGHAVRTVSECVAAAAADLSIATSLGEWRHVAGPLAPVAGLMRAVAPPAIWPLDAFFAGKRAEQAARHARFHDTAQNLEPNLKEGPGGLRDAQLIGWLAQRASGVEGRAALAASGLLTGAEIARLAEAVRTLWRMRFGLHLVAGRAEERLLFEHQRELARRFGYVDEHAQNLAVEQFMQAYYRAAMAVERLGSRAVQRLAERLAGPPEPAEPVDEDFVAVGGHLDLVRPDALRDAPERVLRGYLRLLERPELRGFRSTLLDALDLALPTLPADLLEDAGARATFLAILRHPGPVADTLQRMARHGVLARVLPAFGKVAGRMQYDLFHVYTVDQHTLTVLRFLRRFAEPEGARGFPLAHAVWPRVRKPELMLLAGLFHDIAKGRGGDHSELGAVEAHAFCTRLGLSPAETDLVTWLVRDHLVMSVTAQKQDIADPEVVHRFAERVGDRERLDHLYLLTVADINGTSPRLWNTWRDTLLAELYQATRYALRRGLANPVHASERIAETQRLARAELAAHGVPDVAIDALWATYPEDCFLRYDAGQIAWQTRAVLDAADPARALVRVRRSPTRGTSEVFVHARDRDGLFATITAMLDRFQLTVVEARVVTSRARMSLDTFQVLEPGGHPIESAARERELEERLAHELGRDPLRLTPARRPPSRRQRQFHVPTRLEFQLLPALGRTQLALVCADRPGLLAHVAQAFRACRVRVHDARIATFGERVEDFFLLADENDRPLDADAEARLVAEVTRQIEDGAAAPTARKSPDVHA